MTRSDFTHPFYLSPTYGSFIWMPPRRALFLVYCPSIANRRSIYSGPLAQWFWFRIRDPKMPSTSPAYLAAFSHSTATPSVWLRTRPRRPSPSSRRRSYHRCHVPRSTTAIFGLFCAADRSAVIFLHVQDGGLPRMQFDVSSCFDVPRPNLPTGLTPTFSGIRPNVPIFRE